MLRFVADEVLGVGAGSVTRVAVDGVDGAGKTTFANELADALAEGGRAVIRVSADDFLNPRSVRHARGRTRDFLLEHSDEAARYAALKRQLVKRYPQDRLAYIAGKEQYVTDLEARAIVWARRLPMAATQHRATRHRCFRCSYVKEVMVGVSITGAGVRSRCQMRRARWRLRERMASRVVLPSAFLRAM